MRVTSETGRPDSSLPLSSDPSAGPGLRISVSETTGLGSLVLKGVKGASSEVEFQPVGAALPASAK